MAKKITYNKHINIHLLVQIIDVTNNLSVTDEKYIETVSEFTSVVVYKNSIANM